MERVRAKFKCFWADSCAGLVTVGRRKPKSRREPPPNFNLAYSDYRPVVGLFKLKYAACTFFARQRMNYH